MFLGYRSEKALELFVFLASRSTPLLQHPHLPSAIGWQDAVSHAPRTSGIVAIKTRYFFIKVSNFEHTNVMESTK
jgi:hypothetical protein